MSKELNEIRKKSLEAFKIALHFKDAFVLPDDLKTDLTVQALKLYKEVKQAKVKLGHNIDNLWPRMFNTSHTDWVMPCVYKHTPYSRMHGIHRVAKHLDISVKDILALGEFRQMFVDAIDTDCKYTHYATSDSIVKHSHYDQTFAIFGTTAYEINILKGIDGEEDEGFLSIPLLVGGKIIEQSCDEGSSRIMVTYRIKDRRTKQLRWHVSFHPRGWIYTSELELSREEIMDNIIREVDACKNVFTSPPPGWA